MASIENLAAAHGLTVDSYLEALAELGEDDA